MRRLSGGQRQAVAISRAVGWNARLTIMDEPTAALGVRERTEVENLIERLRDKGRTFLLISHNFDQVMRLSNEIWIMRNGRVVGHRRTSETSGDELVALITGAKPSETRAGRSWSWWAAKVIRQGQCVIGVDVRVLASAHSVTSRVYCKFAGQRHGVTSGGVGNAETYRGPRSTMAQAG